jgi:hypothetical protein
VIKMALRYEIQVGLNGIDSSLEAHAMDNEGRTAMIDMQKRLEKRVNGKDGLGFNVDDSPEALAMEGEGPTGLAMGIRNLRLEAEGIAKRLGYSGKAEEIVYPSDHQTPGQRGKGALARIGRWHSAQPAAQPVVQKRN